MRGVHALECSFGEFAQFSFLLPQRRVLCLGGFGACDEEPFSTEETRRYVGDCLELFGVDRCMFESNFQVDKLSCTYNVLYNSFKRLTANYSAAEKAKLYHDVAAETYKLGG